MNRRPMETMLGKYLLTDKQLDISQDSVSEDSRVP